MSNLLAEIFDKLESGRQQGSPTDGKQIHMGIVIKNNNGDGTVTVVLDGHPIYSQLKMRHSHTTKKGLARRLEIPALGARAIVWTEGPGMTGYILNSDDRVIVTETVKKEYTLQAPKIQLNSAKAFLRMNDKISLSAEKGEGEEKTTVTIKEILTEIVALIRSHTHIVNTTGTAAKQAGTAESQPRTVRDNITPKITDLLS